TKPRIITETPVPSPVIEPIPAKGLRLLVRPKVEGLTLHDPTWSHDGKLLAFSFSKVYPDVKTTGGGIGTVSADGSDLKIIYEEKPESPFENRSFTSPGFSYSDKYLAFLKQTWLVSGGGEASDVMVLILDTGECYSVNPYNVLRLRQPLPAIYAPPSWMKDRDHVFFGAKQAEGYPVDSRLTAIWRAKATGSYDDAIYRNENLDLSSAMPTPSPDGTTLAFVMVPFKKSMPVKLALLDLTSRGAEPVTLMEASLPRDILFSRDGKRLAYLSKDELYIIDINNLNYSKKKFSPGPVALTPDFLVLAHIKDQNLILEEPERKGRRTIPLSALNGKKIDKLAWSPDGKILAISAGGEIWVYYF
ncbi:MAG: PD40 domain-containing protein, partial [Candidatus Eremiobacteraeota bacterium]|nr:PD40 domain-containing protein [Candidatus Eremiobacteraeota bacterium]